MPRIVHVPERRTIAASAMRAVCAALAALSVHAAALAETQSPIELSPYRVQVSVAFASGPSVTAGFRGDVLDGLREQLGRVVGRSWNFEVQENSAICPVGWAGIERLSEAEIAQQIGESPPDKHYFIAVDAAGASCILAGREWDAATRRLGEPDSIEVHDRREIAAAGVTLIGRLFHPVLAVETIDADGATVRLRLRGGALLAAAPDDEILRRQIGPGDLLQPFLRYLDRDRAVREVQQVPWTYLLVDSVDRGRVTGTLISGLRAPLGTGAFRRVEPIALGARPRAAETSLQLVARNDPPQPMAGVKVRIVPKMHARDEARGDETTILTGRDGRLRLSADPEQPLLWLYVQSGEVLLARVPFLPGIELAAVIELPDDSLRLATEGEIDLLQALLIDTVARRAALMARVRKLARESDWKNIEAPQRELASLPGVREFEAQLNAIRVPALQKADARRDRIAAARIRQLCDDAAELIRRYLDADAPRALNEEVEELRRLDAK